MSLTTFKSAERWYGLEESGRKPNTVRIMDATPDESYSVQAGDRIRICLAHDPAVYFERDLTDVSVIGDICGKYLLVWSWRP